MISQTRLDIAKSLKDTKRQLWQIIGSYEFYELDKDKCNDLQKRLSYFSQNHTSELENLYDVIQALSKGLYLIQSGLEWCEPSVGHKSNNKINNTHKARGSQWKLVMIYGGFETVVKTLINTDKPLNPIIIKELIDKCELNNYILLTPPPTKISLEQWREKPSRTDKSAISHFLGLKNGDQKIIEDWIVNAHPISNWVDAVKLTKAIRNATAHGALSATKVQKWGLQEPILTLSENLGEIVIAAIQKLL